MTLADVGANFIELFFIHKPINAIETVNVISKVEEIIRLKDTLEMK
jgi:hypothetical protein